MVTQDGPARTPLEAAVERWNAETGSIEEVYREFLIAELLVVTSEQDPTPVGFDMEGEPRPQVWVCTRDDVVPDVAPGTAPALGYHLMPSLASQDVRIITAPDLQDVKLLGERAVALSVPELTDEQRAAFAAQPESWFAVPDPMFRELPSDQLPEPGIVGWCWIDENGALSGRYRPNPGYQPSPLTIGLPQPEGRLESTLQLRATGYATGDEVLTDLVSNEFGLVMDSDDEGLAPVVVPLPGGKPGMLGATTMRHVPDVAKEVRGIRAHQLEPLLPDTDLLIDAGSRQQVRIDGQELLDRLKQAEPERPAASPLDPRERFFGAMLAGALGDALGYAVEFHDIGMIRRNHGENGVTSPVLRDGVAAISDDTQMMLFTLEGLIRAHVARRRRPQDDDPLPEVQHAYQRWLHTQNQPWERAAGPYARQQGPDGWLIATPELFANRAPGSTCMSALLAFAQTGRIATPQNRINDSKGCGGVMRAAPVAVWSNDPAEVFHAAVGTAALTHSHPSGFLSAGVLAVIVHQLLRDTSLTDSVRAARELLLRWPEHEEQLHALDAAVALAERGPVSPEELTERLGQGWVGEQALAIGLYSVLATDNLRDALLLSVNHSGDSDSTGIVCGNIGGAVHGARAIPSEWLQVLELRQVIETMTNDALAEFSPEPPTDPSWTQRYPAW